MALLPSHAAATLDIAKLRDYCLGEIHPRGRHKARMFASALDITSNDAGWLRAQILEGLARHEATLQARDAFGQRWRWICPSQDKAGKLW